MTKSDTRRERLSNSSVNSLTSEARRYRVNDEKQAGLCIVVQPSGKKTFSVRYRTADGKNSEKTLGDFPSVSVEEARRLASDIRGRVITTQEDPAEEARKARSEGTEKRQRTLKALIEDYLEREETRGRVRGSTLSKKRHHLLNNVVPLAGSWQVSDIKYADIDKLLPTIAKRISKSPQAKNGNAGANDCLKFLKQVFKFGVQREWMDRNPASEVERLPETTNTRIATDAELKALWLHWEARMKAGRPQDWAGSAALQFLSLTLQRGQEVAKAKWSDIDLDAKTWTVPLEDKKEARLAVIPLSEPALEILREAKRRHPEAEHPFPGRTGRAIRRDSITQAFSRDCEVLGIAELTPHDMRRTGRTAITNPERLGFPPHVGEAVIAHQIGDKLTRTYDRNSYLPEKRRALDAWAQEILRVADRLPEDHQEATNVVRMGQSR